MRLIFIHGPAAAGKLTVGQALQEVTGFRLFHNHLVVDTLLAVFQFGSEPFVRLREAMWLSVFREAVLADVSLIFTFTPEASVDPGFIERTVSTIREGGGEVQFVELACPIKVLESRMENASRAQFKKLRSVETFRKLRESSAERFPPLPVDLAIDTSQREPGESAREICKSFGIPMITGASQFENYPPPNP